MTQFTLTLRKCLNIDLLYYVFGDIISLAVTRQHPQSNHYVTRTMRHSFVSSCHSKRWLPQQTTTYISLNFSLSHKSPLTLGCDRGLFTFENCTAGGVLINKENKKRAGMIERSHVLVLSKGFALLKMCVAGSDESDDKIRILFANSHVLFAAIVCLWRFKNQLCIIKYCIE